MTPKEINELQETIAKHREKYFASEQKILSAKEQLLEEHGIIPDELEDAIETAELNLAKLDGQLSKIQQELEKLIKEN